MRSLRKTFVALALVLSTVVSASAARRAAPRVSMKTMPRRVQVGPTCGLYALGMVMDFHQLNDARNPTALVQDSDLERPDSHTLPPTTQLRLLDLARANQYTTQGEMFYGDQLAALARQFGYRTRVVNDVTLADLRAATRLRRPVLLAFDVGDDGNPTLHGGKDAHWTVIHGVERQGGVDLVRATHAWDGRPRTWRAKSFLDSVRQLDESDFPAAPKDIRGTLRGKMIELIPAS
jgi:hypothetical protein